MRARCERRANTAWRTASDLNLVVARYVVWDFENSPWCEERKPGYRSYCHPDHFQPLSHPRAPYSGRRASAQRRDPSAQAPGRGRTRGCSRTLADPPWEPMAVPDQVAGRVEVRTLAIDISGSMRSGRTLSPRGEVGGQPRGRSAKRCGEATIALLHPDFHFSFGSANHRVASDAFIDAGWKALKALRRSTPNG